MRSLRFPAGVCRLICRAAPGLPLSLLLALETGGTMAAEPPAFAKLPYAARPLVQQGTRNLLPSPGFADGLKGWDVQGDVSLVEAEGEKVLRFGPSADGKRASIRVYVPNPRGGVLYRLRLEVKIPPEARAEKGVRSPSLSGWLSHAVDGKAGYGSAKLVATRRGSEWLPREVRLFTHPRASAVYILMGYDGNGAAALTRRWELVEEPVAAAEGRVVLSTPSGDWAEEPRPMVPADAPSPALWAASDPDTLCKTSLPSPAERGQPLAMAGSPGETCVAAVGLFTREPLSGVQLSFNPLEGKAGRLGTTLAWRWIVFHPRRSDYYGRGMTFAYVPDFFVERPEGVDCPAGETTGFQVRLRIPEDARPGEYNGKLGVKAGGHELSLPVRVRVYPFRLAELRDGTRHLYLDANRWSRMTDEQVLAELVDVRDHGFESVTLSSRGAVAVEGGRVTGFQLSDEAVRGVRLTLKAGLEGPFLFWGGWLPPELARRLGLGPEAVRGHADTWPSEVAAGMTEVLKRTKAALAALGIADPVFVAVDEPGHWKAGSLEQLQWDVKVARAAGWPVYCTSSDPPSDPIGQGIDLHCYGGSCFFWDPEAARRLSQETRTAGQKVWYYCTGVYSGQVGNLVRNRYLGGLFFARSGADGSASWTFQRPRGNAFDDFLADPRTGEAQSGQACVTYPDPEHPGTNLDTPHWEGLRQGFLDHRYVETLRGTIAAARARGRAAEAAQAEKRLEALLARVPWNGDPFEGPRVTNARLDEIRSELAREIETLAGQ